MVSASFTNQPMDAAGLIAMDMDTSSHPPCGMTEMSVLYPDTIDTSYTLSPGFGPRNGPAEPDHLPSNSVTGGMADLVHSSPGPQSPVAQLMADGIPVQPVRENRLNAPKLVDLV